MLTVDEALAAIIEAIEPFTPEPVQLDQALGLALAADAASQFDSPPFDKAVMDGFAVRADDVPDGRATLRLVEEVTAGRLPTKPLRPGEATQIMTGAPMPDGADAVVRIEDTSLGQDASGGTLLQIATRLLEPGTNLIHRGTSARRGECLVPAGRPLRPQDLAVLAELGPTVVNVRRRPKVGVLATGDELVPIDQAPGPGQIRNSNETMLVAQIRRAGGEPVALGIAHDDPDHLRERIEAGLNFDLLLLSGGVSAGKLDLVPRQLDAAGVRKVFHKVAVKPGQPIWFGVHTPGTSSLDTPRPRAAGAVRESTSRDIHTQPRSARWRGLSEDDSPTCGRCFVFGLPGNPVSSMVCFELFARTAIRRLMGIEPPRPVTVRARLTTPRSTRGDRPTYHPARLDWHETGPRVAPVVWHGSSDLRATAEANAMALFAAGERTYEPGDVVEVVPWESAV